MCPFLIQVYLFREFIRETDSTGGTEVLLDHMWSGI